MQGVNFPLVRTGLLPVLAAGLAIGCARAPRPVVVSAPAVRPGITSYDGVVKVDPGVGAIDARWRIALSAEALRGDSVSFLLNEGLAVARLGGADVLGYSRAADSGTAHLTVRFAPAVHARGVATMEIADAGRPVVMWARREEIAAAIREERRNPEYLPGALLPDGVTATADAAEALDGADLLFIALPSHTLRDNLSAWEDASLIGGIRVVVGDEVLDTSVRARLEQMKVALTA